MEEAGKRLQERADATEADFESMLANLRSAGDGLLDRVRGGAGEIQGRVEAILGTLPDLANWDEDDEPDEPDDDGFDDGEDEAGDDGSDDELDDAPTDDPGARIAAEHELAEVVPDLTRPKRAATGPLRRRRARGSSP